jgi:hypothetical protein
MFFPDPGSGYFFHRGSRIRGKKALDVGSRIRKTAGGYNSEQLLTFFNAKLLNQRQTLTVNGCLPFFPIGRFGAVQSADFLRGTCIK